MHVVHAGAVTLLYEPLRTLVDVVVGISAGAVTGGRPSRHNINRIRSLWPVGTSLFGSGCLGQKPR